MEEQEAAELAAAIRRHRFCLLTEMEATQHYMVWLCLQLGAVPIVSHDLPGHLDAFALLLPIVRAPPRCTCWPSGASVLGQ